jgi:hypothetical protein
MAWCLALVPGISTETMVAVQKSGFDEVMTIGIRPGVLHLAGETDSSSVTGPIPKTLPDSQVVSH